MIGRGAGPAGGAGGTAQPAHDSTVNGPPPPPTSTRAPSLASAQRSKAWRISSVSTTSSPTRTVTQLQPLVVPHCGQQWHEPARTIDTPHW